MGHLHHPTSSHLCYNPPMNPPKPRPLTPKQRRFVNALPTASSATAAAITAGYASSPRHVAESAAHVTLRNADVQAALAELQAKAEAPAIASLIERKTKLSEVLRKPVPDDVGVLAILAASDQLNRMESVYVQRSQTLVGGKITIEFVGFGGESDEKPAVAPAEDEGKA